MVHIRCDRLLTQSFPLNHRLSTVNTSRTLYNFRLAGGVGSGETIARIRHLFSAGVSTVPGIPQTFSISVISFTDMKFRSHWPSVSPFACVLVRFPLHINRRPEAALASTIVPPIMNAVARAIAEKLAKYTRPFKAHLRAGLAKKLLAWGRRRPTALTVRTALPQNEIALLARVTRTRAALGVAIAPANILQFFRNERLSRT
jgi:hypothetical protein